MPFGGAKQNALELPYLWSSAGRAFAGRWSPWPSPKYYTLSIWESQQPFPGSESEQVGTKATGVFLLAAKAHVSTSFQGSFYPHCASQSVRFLSESVNHPLPRSLPTAAFHAWKLSPVFWFLTGLYWSQLFQHALSQPHCTCPAYEVLSVSYSLNASFLPWLALIPCCPRVPSHLFLLRGATSQSGILCLWIPKLFWNHLPGEQPTEVLNTLSQLLGASTVYLGMRMRNVQIFPKNKIMALI